MWMKDKWMPIGPRWKKYQIPKLALQTRIYCMVEFRVSTDPKHSELHMPGSTPMILPVAGMQYFYLRTDRGKSKVSIQHRTFG